MDSFTKYVPTNVVFKREIDDSVVQNRFAFNGVQACIRPYRNSRYRLCTNVPEITSDVFAPLMAFLGLAVKNKLLSASLSYTSLSDGWFAFDACDFTLCREMFAIFVASVVNNFYKED